VEAEPFLAIEDLEVRYESRNRQVVAVRNANFKISKSEIIGLAGESGCGKSTLGLAIMQLLPANGRVSKGSVFFDGTDLLDLSEKDIRAVRWKQIALVFQGALNALNPLMRIKDQIAESMIAHEQISREEAYDRGTKLLSEVWLDPSVADKFPHELSGGMRQRVMIAMAVSCRPKLVIADEPTTALDTVTQAQIVNLLKNLVKEYSVAVAFVSHDIALLSSICDRISIMYAGSIVETASAGELVKNPNHPYTKALMRAIPDVAIDEAPASIQGDISDAPEIGCSFYPRCPHAFDICKAVYPKETWLGVEKMVRCYLYGDGKA
jgi:peptide/nickel transport system ATP-binding protein